jgi:hypothetical protein
MSLAQLSNEISKFLNVDESNFIMYKVEKEETTELVHLQDTIGDTTPFNGIQIRYGKRLKAGEGRVEVYMLDLINAPEVSSTNKSTLDFEQKTGHINLDLTATCFELVRSRRSWAK